MRCFTCRVVLHRYLKRFSSVELKVNMAHISDKYLYSKKRQKLTSKGGDGVTWFIADLLDTFSGRPLHEIWRFKSSPISIKVRFDWRLFVWSYTIAM